MMRKLRTKLPVQNERPDQAHQAHHADQAPARDEIGGRAVNLIPMEKPADIYAAVAEKTIKALKEIAERKAHDAEIVQDDEEREKEELRVRAAQWWLDYGITRKVTKRNCMTFPYGSKERGFSDQILEDTLRPFVKEDAARSRDAAPCLALPCPVRP